MPSRGPIARRLAAGALAVSLLSSVSCARLGPSSRQDQPGTGEILVSPSTSHDRQSPAVSATVAAPFRHPLPGMRPILRSNVYAATYARGARDAGTDDPAYLYVPNADGTTTIIDQRSKRIIRTLDSGSLSQHVSPSFDMKTLYVNASVANHLVALDPGDGTTSRILAAPRPYNLYFTPDGATAVIMSEQNNRIVFADPKTFFPRSSLSDPRCLGPNHAEFSANGRFFVVTCEFSGSLLKVSTESHAAIGHLDLGDTSKPQDIRLSPDGTTFYVADLTQNRVVMLGWKRLKVVGSIRTPAGPHAFTLSRDGRYFYISDRGAGKVSVLSTATNRIVDTWVIPGGGSPDMGGVSANGRLLWLSGRYDGYVYGFNTLTGTLISKIFVGGSPHGLAVWPQPGRYSLGHNGDIR